MAKIPAASAFGIGEWYARSFVRMTDAEREQLAEPAKRGLLDLQCPPKASCAAVNPRAVPGKLNCNKKGGVCSIREYVRIDANGQPKVEPKGNLRTTCPVRFLQDGTIFKWIGEAVLGTSAPVVIKEVEFLESAPDEPEEVREIGYIDNVLIRTDRNVLEWCALEIQAVYFSGDAMGMEFENIQQKHGALGFPIGNRHPDYRSSGPKRLMPQLQIKVPALRRWGKKMAVVVDEDFYSALGEMRQVKEISNADIAWFVIRYNEQGKEAVIEPSFVELTTLESAVEGLVGGAPVSLQRFEEKIVLRARRNYPDLAIPNPGR